MISAISTAKSDSGPHEVMTHPFPPCGPRPSLTWRACKGRETKSRNQTPLVYIKYKVISGFISG